MTMDAAAAATATQRRRRPRRRGPQSEEDAAQAGVAEETLLALRLLGRGAGLRHPLHGHAYARYTALRPRVCHACEGAILGPFSKACHCLACGLVVHRACVMRVPKAPCGSYRGLRDPDGRRSLPREAQEAAVAAAAAAAEKTWASPPPKLAPGPKQAVVGDGDEEEGEGEEQQQGQRLEQKQADGPPPTTAEGTAAATSANALSERRSMTYEALAMVGRLVGTMTGSGAAAASVPASGSASPVKDTGGASSAGGGFGFATLRSGARAIAGAYAGYTSRAQQEEDEVSSSDAASSHLQAARLLGLSKGLGMPSPVATAWSQLAQRILREAGTDAGGGGQGRLLDFTAFVKHLEALEAAEAATAVFAEVEEKTPTSGGSNAAGSAGGRSSSKRGGLIADILKSERTAPGYLWAACLRHFRRRHDPESAVDDEDDDSDATDQSGEGGSSAALLPPAPASQDAAAIIHEVALVLVDFVPGLLSASYLALGAYEEAFEAVEGLVMATLAPFVLAECQARTGPLTAAVAAWYERRQDGDRDGEEEDHDDHGPAIERAAQELRALVGECTGPRKVRRVLQCCLALGEGEGRVMSADELLPALGKAVRRAAVPALPAHLAFVEETCDTGALLGAEGYALTSLQVVVSLIVQPPSDEEADEQQEPLVDRIDR